MASSGAETQKSITDLFFWHKKSGDMMRNIEILNNKLLQRKYKHFIFNKHNKKIIFSIDFLGQQFTIFLSQSRTVVFTKKLMGNLLNIRRKG